VTGSSDASARILGVWKLVSFEAEIQATGQKESVMGQNPTEFAIFTQTRALFLLTGEARKPAKTVQERADLLNTLVAYTGTYRLEGEEWITNVDVAWNPEWIGTEQKRFFKLEGDRLQVLTRWGVHPNWPDKGMTRRILTFER
jgi:lipocalin-like protein